MASHFTFLSNKSGQFFHLWSDLRPFFKDSLTKPPFGMTSTEYLYQQCQVWRFFFWVPTPSCWSRRAWSFTTFAKLKQSFCSGNGDGTFPVLVSVSRVEKMKGFEFYRFQFATGNFQTKLLVSIDGLWMSLVESFVSLLLNWLNQNSETHLPVHLLSFSDTSRSSRSTDTNHYQQQHNYTYSQKGPTKTLWAATYFVGDFPRFSRNPSKHSAGLGNNSSTVTAYQQFKNL